LTAEKTTPTAAPERRRSVETSAAAGEPDGPGVSESVEFERMLDDKGRITIPPPIRRALGTEYVSARGAEGSVLVVPAALWPVIEARLNVHLPADDRYSQLALHNRTGAALDRQGRLKVPRHLLEWACLEAGDAAAIISRGDTFEIWNKRNFAAASKERPGAGNGRAPAESTSDAPGTEPG
jgi:DNA-binding transcriptional regulator/RsmH inhibitor MraZ